MRTTEDDKFEIAWTRYPKRPGNSRADALKQWRARVNQGADPDEILAGVERYSAFCHATGSVGTNFVKMGATFFGPANHYESDWEIPDHAESRNGSRDRPRSAVEEVALANERRERERRERERERPPIDGELDLDVD